MYKKVCVFSLYYLISFDSFKAQGRKLKKNDGFLLLRKERLINKIMV